jgi:hypothetical protein
MKELSIQEMTALRGGTLPQFAVGGLQGEARSTPTNFDLKINSGEINRAAQVAGSPEEPAAVIEFLKQL